MDLGSYDQHMTYIVPEGSRCPSIFTTPDVLPFVLTGVPTLLQINNPGRYSASAVVHGGYCQWRQSRFREPRARSMAV